MIEEWRDIKDWEGYYIVSNTGKIASLVGFNGSSYYKRKEPLIMKPYQKSEGYLQIALQNKKLKKNQKHAYVHRIVAETFIENKENKPQINHIDFDKTNNDIRNLEWVTSKENHAHANKSYRRLQRKKNLQKDSLERRFDETVFRNKDKVLELEDLGYTVEQITKYVDCGRDMVVRILRMNGKL